MMRLGVDAGAEVEPAGGHAADHAGLGGQGDESMTLLLVGDRGDALGHADAEIDDRRSAGSSKAARRAMILRSSSAIGGMPASGTRISPAKRRVVAGGVGLPVVLRLGDHHAVHQDARDLHLPRVQRAARRRCARPGR